MESNETFGGGVIGGGDAGDGFTQPSETGDTNNNTFVDPSLGGMAARAAFLALYVIVGFVGNCVLIATIAQSSRLKIAVLNLFVLSMAVANVIDCIANMPLILGATITEKWDYGTTVCHLNAFGLQLISIVVILDLLLMALDRFIAVLNPNKHDERLTKARTNVLIVYVWLHALGFSIPILIESVVPIRAFPARYLCTIANGASLLYMCMTSVFCYLVPFVLISGFLIHILRVACGERLRMRRMRHREGSSDSDRLVLERTISESKRLKTELVTSKYLSVLFLLWCILQAPYLVLTSITLYSNSDELSQTPVIKEALSSITYTWEVELAFTWMKLSYPLFLPFVTFCWKKEVWQKFKNLVLCRKSNLIVDASPKGSPRRRRGQAAGVIANGNVPVLFATENGLHIQSAATDLHSNGTRKCDVMGSQDFLQIDEDTSDYDSSGEIDPFSGSNPVSVRTEYGGRSGENSLNNSKDKRTKTVNAEVTRDNNDSADTGNDVTVVNEVSDSGYRSTGKKRRKVSDQESPRGVDITDDPPNDTEVNEEVMEEEEKEIDVTVDNVHQSPEHRERISHDSGVGSLEDKKKRKKRKTALDVEERANDDEHINKTVAMVEEAECEDASAAKTSKDKKAKKKKKRQDKVESDQMEMQDLVPSRQPRAGGGKGLGARADRGLEGGGVQNPSPIPKPRRPTPLNIDTKKVSPRGTGKEGHKQSEAVTPGPDTPDSESRPLPPTPAPRVYSRSKSMNDSSLPKDANHNNLVRADKHRTLAADISGSDRRGRSKDPVREREARDADEDEEDVPRPLPIPRCAVDSEGRAASVTDLRQAAQEDDSSPRGQVSDSSAVLGGVGMLGAVESKPKKKRKKDSQTTDKTALNASHRVRINNAFDAAES